MAKKFVRGVTGVEDINSFDKTLTNVNDIVSDGQDTFVHTKKGKTESYYKLTDSVKQVESTDNLLTISKEDGTVSIANSGLATKEELAGKQDTLSVGDGLYLTNNNLTLNPKLYDTGDVDYMFDGNFIGENLTNAPSQGWFLYENFKFKKDDRSYIIQRATRYEVLGVTGNKKYIRTYRRDGWSLWQEQVGDKSVIDGLLNQKQNTLTNNTSIGVVGTGLRQLYALKQTYSVTGAVLKTHVKSVSENTNLNSTDEEFNFIVKLNKGVSSVNFTLNTHDTTKFSNIMTAYGDNNTVRISGCVFTLSGSTLTVSTANNTDQNYVITFSDII